MSALRDEIRAILREEIAALLQEQGGTVTEAVSIRTTADLNRFAQDLLRRAEDVDFSSRVKRGQITFSLSGTAVQESASAERAIVSSPPKPAAVTVDKALLTERDIIDVSGQTKVLRIPYQCRLTPLAKDEARRIGLRIERVEK